MNDTPELVVGVLAYPGCFASEVFGIIDVLTIAGRVAEGHRQQPAFQTVVMSSRRRITASGGVSIGVLPVRPVDVLVVPGFELVPGDDLHARTTHLSPEIDVIRDNIAGGRATVSICVGAFLLGAAGALDGRKATTSWLFADQLQKAVPTAEVVSDSLVITDTGVTTTAAFSAMYDFVIGLIERHHGTNIARLTARIALLDQGRTSQAPYVDTSLLPTAGSTFATRVQRHLERNLEHAYDLAELAAHFHVSTRTLLRHFKTETGGTPLAHLQRARVNHAQHLLETTNQTLGDVHRAVGNVDSGAFTALFVRHTGLRPRDYRARFQVHRPRGHHVVGLPVSEGRDVSPDAPATRGSEQRSRQ